MAEHDGPGHQDPEHLITEAIGLVHASLDATADSQAVFLPTSAKAEALRELVRAESRIAALKLQVLAAAGDVAEQTAHKDPGAWLADRARLDPRACQADGRLAVELDSRWEATASALSAGEVNLPQARVITEVLDELVDDVAHYNRRVRDHNQRAAAAAKVADKVASDVADPASGAATAAATAAAAKAGAAEQGAAGQGAADTTWGPERVGAPAAPGWVELGPEVVVEAEQHLLVEAKQFDPHQLRVLGRRLLDVVDPDGAEAREADKLARAEEHAARKQRLGLRKVGDGTTRLSGLIPDHIAHRLTTVLESFAQPRKQALAADGKAMLRPKLLAMALGDLLERLDPDRLPTHGGDATTVVITLTLDDLLAKLGAGLGAAGLGHDHDDLTGHGGKITATQARRLACQAHLIPVVLGTHGQVLDVGQATRLHTPVMRKALRIRDRHCRAQGCTVPATWCEAHHLRPWSHGGNTSVENGILLCTHHHHRVHDPAYDHHLQPDRTITFHRRT